VAASLSPAVCLLATSLGLGGLLSPASVTAQAPPLREPQHRAALDALATGALLVSARRLPDPNFANTVILLVDVGRTGAVGLIVNRRSDATLARAFPTLKPTLATASQAFFGGPVQKTQAMALARSPDAPAGARHVVAGIHVVAGAEAIEALIASGAPASRFRVYFGYAGWSPGQLESEIRQGAWHVLAGDVDVVFDPDPASTWQRQIARTTVIQARLTHSPPW